MHNYVRSKITVSVVGARGYTGLELIKLLLTHPFAELKYAFASDNFSLDAHIANSKIKNVRCLKETEIFANKTDIVFLATPAEVSMHLAPRLLALGSKVIDLSGAFRLKNHDYKKWYNFEHDQNELLKQANYGLNPWIGPKAANSKLIANPGCYATAINMALIPVLKNKLLKSENIVIDAKSGTTGAGKKAADNLIFSEVSTDCLPYKVGEHQHLPEIIETIEAFCGVQIEPFFSTSLIPIRRGIIAAIYGCLEDGVTLTEIHNAFAQAYSENSLVKFGTIQESDHLLQIRKVVGTAKTHISYKVQGNKLYLFSTIDNLLKGAASQAIENFNLVLDLPNSFGLDSMEAQT